MLAQSDTTPELPGIRELTGQDMGIEATVAAIRRSFEAATGWQLEAGGWTDDEVAQHRELVRDKYGSATWNDRR